MIFTYPDTHPSVPPTAIPVNSGQLFDLSEARRILDLSRYSDVALAYTGLEWWNLRQISKLFDFLSYRGASLIHIVGEFDTPHSAYLSERLEKLYTAEILDEWTQA